jgi:hypothetical protein
MLTAARRLALQRSAGNQAVQRAVARSLRNRLQGFR